MQGKARIAPLLATIGLSFVLDQLVQLVCSADPRAVPSDLPDWRLTVRGVSIGAMDFLIAAVGIVSAALLYGFLRFTKLGLAVRATAQDRDAALQMGVNVNAVLPSTIDTPANRASMPKADFGRWVPPVDIAEVMLFLASEESRAITGALIPVSGKT